jgi:hypothetical protein
MVSTRSIPIEMYRNHSREDNKMSGGFGKTQAVGIIEKDGKHTTLEMIGLTRSSSQEVAEGYGPSIQKSELVADVQSQGYRLACIHDIVEPATIDLEERELFNEVMAEAIALRKENRCDGLSFSRCDRLSRRFDAALQIALDCKKTWPYPPLRP